jgi:hypothetical protein
MHFLRVIPLHAALLVAAEGIASEVGVLVVKVLLCFICLLGRGGLIDELVGLGRRALQRKPPQRS